ncbi:hypothetical protein ACFQT0_03570 [Hymenobacter humi]|uniref:G-D-S-L family lipolytic protein n=1 Tax=Hymenobacter humi TaxID=1411620 RepID=A0ABW2TZD8_9BACT
MVTRSPPAPATAECTGKATNSYPNILAGQFKLVGGTDFTQPLFTEAQSNGSGYLRLTGFTAAGLPITAPVTANLGVRAVSPQILYTKFTDRINNLGVDGIRMSDIQTAGYTSTNAHFERITPDANLQQTYLQRVQATVADIKPTFFTEWLGNNDVLGYATSGGAVASRTITPAATFTANTKLILDALVKDGAKGLVSNIPDVAGIPFFNTVGPSFRASLAAAAVPSAAPFIYTTGVLAPGQPNTRVTTAKVSDIRDAAGAGNLLLTLTASPYVSLYGRPGGKYWRDFYQQVKPSLPATYTLTQFLGPALLGGLAIDTTKNFGQDIANPFPSTLLLDGTEQTAVTNATNGFNTTLAAEANARNLALFDANAFFRSVAGNGIITNTVPNSAAYISGNLFSLDGVHPTPAATQLWRMR